MITGFETKKENNHTATALAAVSNKNERNRIRGYMDKAPQALAQRCRQGYKHRIPNEPGPPNLKGVYVLPGRLVYTKSGIDSHGSNSNDEEKCSYPSLNTDRLRSHGQNKATRTRVQINRTRKRGLSTASNTIQGKFYAILDDDLKSSYPKANIGEIKGTNKYWIELHIKLDKTQFEKVDLVTGWWFYNLYQKKKSDVGERGMDPTAETETAGNKEGSEDVHRVKTKGNTTGDTKATQRIQSLKTKIKEIVPITEQGYAKEDLAPLGVNYDKEDSYEYYTNTVETFNRWSPKSLINATQVKIDEMIAAIKKERWNICQNELIHISRFISDTDNFNKGAPEEADKQVVRACLERISKRDCEINFPVRELLSLTEFMNTATDDWLVVGEDRSTPVTIDDLNDSVNAKRGIKTKFRALVSSGTISPGRNYSKYYSRYDTAPNYGAAFSVCNDNGKSIKNKFVIHAHMDQQNKVKKAHMKPWEHEYDTGYAINDFPDDHKKRYIEDLVDARPPSFDEKALL